MSKMTQVWTIVQNTEGETIPWTGLFGSEDEAKAAVEEASGMLESWGDEEPPTIEWAEHDQTSVRTGRTEGNDGDATTWILIRHT